MTRRRSRELALVDHRGMEYTLPMLGFPLAVGLALLAWLAVGAVAALPILLAAEIAVVVQLRKVLEHLTVVPRVRFETVDVGWRIEWSRPAEDVLPAAVLIGGLWGAVAGFALIGGLQIDGVALGGLPILVLWGLVVGAHVGIVLAMGTGRLLAGHALIDQRYRVMLWGVRATTRVPVDEIESVRTHGRGLHVEGQRFSEVLLPWVPRQRLEPLLEQISAAIRTLGGLPAKPWRG